ncbi:MAG: hypothetical protein RIC12_01315 [Pirellulales bacterium]
MVVWHRSGRLVAMKTATAIVLILAPTLALAWSESAHHVIALLAYERLSEAERDKLQAIIAAHPCYAEDFNAPPNVRDVDRWRIGRAAYWPDVARKLPEYNRPNWHWELGALKRIAFSKAPEGDTFLPEGATLESRNLHLAQAIKLCQRVANDPGVDDSDRALAISWLSHLEAVPE